MTKEQAQQCINDNSRIQTSGYDSSDEEYDTGVILRLIASDSVLVGWDSGVQTPCGLDDIEVES